MKYLLILAYFFFLSLDSKTIFNNFPAKLTLKAIDIKIIVNTCMAAIL